MVQNANRAMRMRRNRKALVKAKNALKGVGLLKLKTILRKGLWFADLGSVFRWRALSRSRRDRPFLLFEGRVYTYAEVYGRAVRYAALFGKARRDRTSDGRIGPGEPLAVGLYQENTPEFVFALFGATLSGDVLFGINTGFREETLANVINQAGMTLLLADPARVERIEAILPRLEKAGREDLLRVEGGGEGEGPPVRTVEEALAACEGEPGSGRRGRIDIFSPLIVIYTQRGDDTYRPLTPEAFAAIKSRFLETGREELLTRY